MENENKPLMVGQSGSFGCCKRVMARAAWILTLGNLSVTRTSIAWWMRSKRSSSIWAFSAMLPSNLLISWHTRKRTAWLLALWDWEERMAEIIRTVLERKLSETEVWGENSGRRGDMKQRNGDEQKRKMSRIPQESVGVRNRWSSTWRERRQMGQDKTRLRRSRDINHNRASLHSECSPERFLLSNKYQA